MPPSMTVKHKGRNENTHGIRFHFSLRRNTLTVLALLFAITAIKVHADNHTEHQCPDPFNYTISTPNPQLLTLEQFVTILENEAGEEFGYSKNQTAAELLWQQSTLFEWCRAWGEEVANEKAYPFFICDSESNLSGSARKAQVLSDIADAAASSSSSTEEEPKLIALLNEQLYTCFLTTIVASVASDLPNRETLTVAPVTYAMKLIGGIAKSAENPITEDKVDVLDVILCPGVLEDHSDIKDLTPNELNEAVMKFIQGKGFFKDENSVGNQVFFWAIEIDIENENQTARADFWTDAFADYLEDNEVCKQFFDLLQFEFTVDSGGVNSLSNMIVNFDDIGTYVDDNPDADEKIAEICIRGLIIAIALLPESCALHIRPKFDVNNVVASWLTQSGIENVNPWFDEGITGKGQVVAVSDTGIDINNCYFWDDSTTGKEFIKSEDYIDLNQRKVVQYDPFANFDDYQYGHGTHVSGTVVGHRAVDGITQSNGAANGIAPDAKVAFIDIGLADERLTIPSSSRLLGVGRVDKPYAAKLHSASWGSAYNGYGTNARSFDGYIYNNDDFLMMVAAGNDGSGNTPNTVGDPATAKNVIAVGAGISTGSHKQKSQLGPNYIADFSSRGPTQDGRTKPDIVAVGSYVLSAGARPLETGECDPPKIPGAGERSGGLLSIQGTSMATPVTSGTAALVRQYFEEGYYPSGQKNESNAYSPSGALVKAVLMNGAQYMTGVDNRKGGVFMVKPYDDVQNFGRISLVDSLYLQDKSNVQAMAWDRETIDDRVTKGFQVQIDTSGGCTNGIFSATLVWVDPPAFPGCTSCVLNDLDLYVIKNGDTDKKYYPNGRSERDSVNNAERVQIDGVVNGDNFTLNVNAYNLFTESQMFSLVATGCFGGSGNSLNTAKDVFTNDNSAAIRRRNILMGIFIPLAVIILGLVVAFIFQRRKDDNEHYTDEAELTSGVRSDDA